MKANLENKILGIVDLFIKRNGFNPNEFSDSKDLLSNGAIDSLDVVNIVCEIQQSLGYSVNINKESLVINKRWFLN